MSIAVSVIPDNGGRAVDGKEHDPVGCLMHGGQRIGRVGARDQQKDKAVIENAQDLLSAVGRQGVVDGRNRIHERHREAEDQHTDQIDRLPGRGP